MMHESMGWMMAFMWLFWLVLIGGIIVAILVGVRALRAGRADSVLVLPVQYLPASSLARPIAWGPVPSGPGPAAPLPGATPPPAPAPEAGNGPAESDAGQLVVPAHESILRLLDDDERRLYQLVGQRAPDLIQGDLVALSGFSKAKVSRVLDRLERKRLVVRLRRGMGKRVVLAPTPPNA